MPSKKLDVIYSEMKELNQDELKRIAYNCSKATFLIEKQQISRITMREKLELNIHLAGCSVCRIYEKQSMAINRMIKNLFQTTQRNELTLDENFKQRLKEQIERKLKDE